MKLDFSGQGLKKNTQKRNFMKIRPAGAELFHSDGETDGRMNMTKLIVAVSQFCERNWKYFFIFLSLTNRVPFIRRAAIISTRYSTEKLSSQRQNQPISDVVKISLSTRNHDFPTKIFPN